MLISSDSVWLYGSRWINIVKAGAFLVRYIHFRFVTGYLVSNPVKKRAENIRIFDAHPEKKSA
jgi:hypothetical protein